MDRDFFVSELRKPVHAFGRMIRWISKQAALYVMRLILWGFFFVLPSFMLLCFGFHWMTAKIQREFGSPPVASHAAPAPVPTPQSEPGSAVLRTLSQDLRFWMRELERFRS